MEPQIGPRFWPGFLKTLPPLRNVTYVVFFAAGMISALWAGLIPSLKTALNVDEGVLGTMLLGLGIGSLVMMPVTGASSPAGAAARYCARAFPSWPSSS